MEGVSVETDGFVGAKGRVFGLSLASVSSPSVLAAVAGAADTVLEN